jgi:hypothetical protein
MPQNTEQSYKARTKLFQAGIGGVDDIEGYHLQ